MTSLRSHGSEMNKIEQAALNNALWIDTVCRAHRCSTVLEASAWFTYGATPPFYPNAVIIGNAYPSGRHMQVAKNLLQAGISGSFALKDSFQALDLHPLGYQVLLDSQWIWKEPEESNLPDKSGIEWEVIRTASGLAEWEAAWAGDSATSGIFLPELLNNKDVLIVAARQENKIVAGCIANRGPPTCVGVSNIFLPNKESQLFRQSCMATIQHAFPGLPMVGYESGDDLTDMLKLGFEAIGQLRVWYYDTDPQ